MVPNVPNVPYARPSFTEEDLQAAFEVMKGKQWLQGEQTAAFEKELAVAQGRRRAVFVNSGSSALLVAAHALAGKGGQRDTYYKGEVIVPAIQFPTLNNSLIHAGFIPVIVDVDDTLTIHPSRVVEAINEHTVGIVVVHVAGNVGYLDELARIADAYGLWFLEDNCDGFGGKYNTRPVGSFGTVSVTSFHVAHIIGTGQGGAVFTNDDELANVCVSYRDWGRMVGFNDHAPGIPPLPVDHLQRYTYSHLGFNLSPLELQAVLGRRQLPHVEEFVQARAGNRGRISSAAVAAGFEVPRVLGGAQPAWFACPMRVTVQQRQWVFEKLQEAAIEYRNILSGNISLHPAYRGKLKVKLPLTVADEWGRRGFWVSCHSSLTEEEIHYLCGFFEGL